MQRGETYLGSEDVVHGQDVNLRMDGEGRFDPCTYDLCALDFGNLVHLTTGDANPLERHVPRRAVCA
jgi:hypothetical protein